MFLKAQAMQHAAVKGLLRDQTMAINQNTNMVQSLVSSAGGSGSSVWTPAKALGVRLPVVDIKGVYLVNDKLQGDPKLMDRVAVFYAATGGSKPKEFVKAVMLKLMPAKTARLFNWGGSAFGGRDIDDGIPNLLGVGADGKPVCTHKSKFEDMTGIVEMLKLASRRNKGYPETLTVTDEQVVGSITYFFHHAVEYDRRLNKPSDPAPSEAEASASGSNKRKLEEKRKSPRKVLKMADMT